MAPSLQKGIPVKRTFNKTVVFSDCHFGLKYNSDRHNLDNMEFIKWLIDLAKREGAETCMFLGDFHHNRSSINVNTLNYSMQALRLLNDAFEKVYMLIGNHDLFYKDRRDIHSVVIAEEFSNIELIDAPKLSDDVAFIPWLIGSEWEDIKKIKSKYMFGHFEIPGFKMNSVIAMPDTGTIRSAHFKNQEYVFTGHFHMRQKAKNIHYIGNPFGHNYADSWDTQRGCMMLEWGGTPKYIDWPAGPTYIRTPLSRLMFNLDEFLNDRVHAQITIDIPLSHEDGKFIRELLINSYGVRELTFIHDDTSDLDQTFEGDVGHKTVNEIVIEQLAALETTHCDPIRLMEIYNNLDA